MFCEVANTSIGEALSDVGRFSGVFLATGEDRLVATAHQTMLHAEDAYFAKVTGRTI